MTSLHWLLPILGLLAVSLWCLDAIDQGGDE